MDITNIGGLPAHPLLVHLPVVLVPLATLGALLMLLRPSWRRTYEIPTAVLAVLAAIATQLAIGSGESLEERVAESDLVEQHSKIAEQARPFIFVFALIMVAVVVVDLWSRRQAAAAAPSTDGSGGANPGEADGGAVSTITRPTTSVARSTAATVAVVLTALGLVFGVISTVQVYRTGHSGAKATWHDTKPAESGGESGGSTGDGDGDGD